MDDTTVAAIGDLPKGRGLLGALIEHPEPILIAAYHRRFTIRRISPVTLQ